MAVFAAAAGERLERYRPAIEAAIARITAVERVTTVADPLTAGTVSPDGRIGFLLITFDRPSTELGPEPPAAVADALTPARAAGIAAEFGGDAAFINAPTETSGTEAAGLLTALVLVVAFGTIVAALVPLALALVAVGAGLGCLASIGFSTSLVVLVAVATALTLLPALLSLLGDRVDAGRPLRRRRPIRPAEGTAWWRFAHRVSGRPWPYLAVASVVLLALAAPALQMKTGFPRPHRAARRHPAHLHRRDPGRVVPAADGGVPLRRGAAEGRCDEPAVDRWGLRRRGGRVPVGVAGGPVEPGQDVPGRLADADHLLRARRRWSRCSASGCRRPSCSTRPSSGWYWCRRPWPFWAAYWWLPRWLDRRLPHVRMESAEVQRQPEPILAGVSGHD